MDSLKNVFVKDLMVTDVKTIDHASNIYDATSKMVEDNVGSLIITYPGKGDNDYLKSSDIKGMVPVFFTLQYLLDENHGKTTNVENSLFTDFITINKNESIYNVFSNIVNNKSWRLIVVDDDDTVCGLLSATDIIKYIHNKIEEEK